LALGSAQRRGKFSGSVWRRPEGADATLRDCYHRGYVESEQGLGALGAEKSGRETGDFARFRVNSGELEVLD
jgi:hypothetical protein